jgi:hypothetical protein
MPRQAEVKEKKVKMEKGAFQDLNFLIITAPNPISKSVAGSGIVSLLYTDIFDISPNTKNAQ